MAILDSRLLPLIETLSDRGLDWLAFELIESIRRGREPVEPEELLVRARAKVVEGGGGEPETVSQTASAAPILGD